MNDESEIMYVLMFLYSNYIAKQNRTANPDEKFAPFNMQLRWVKAVAEAVKLPTNFNIMILIARVNNMTNFPHYSLQPCAMHIGSW